MLDEVGMHLARRAGEALAEIGITLRMQCVLLHALEAERSQIEIAELSRLDKTTMVTTMDQLEDAGYAVRKPSPSDRRARIVVVTDEGARIAAAGQKIVDAVHRQALAALQPSERSAFLTALRTLAQATSTSDRPEASPAGVRRRRQRTTG